MQPRGRVPDIWRTLWSTLYLYLTLGNKEFSPHRDFDKHTIDNSTQYFIKHVGFIFENLKNIL